MRGSVTVDKIVSFPVDKSWQLDCVIGKAKD